MTLALIIASVWRTPDTSVSALLLVGGISAVSLLARFVKNQKK